MDTLHSLAFAAQETAEDGLSKPFAVLHTGTFKRGDFGELKVTEADLDKAVENFAALTRDEQGKPEAPVDFDHSFSKGQGSESAGWMKELYRDGDKLMTRVKWTPTAEQKIADKAFRYISPEFTTAWRNEKGEAKGFALLAAGLTSRPFLKSLPPVALSDEVAQDLAEQARAIAGAAGIELSAEGASTERKTPAMAADAKTVTLSEEEVTTLRETASQVATLTEKITGLEESRDQAVAMLDETKKTLRTEQVDKLLGQARREGRIDAGAETTTKWHERADKHGVEFVKDLLNEFPADTIPMGERGHGTDAPTAETAPEGVDPEHFALDRKIKAYVAEHSVSYSEAAVAVAE